MDLNLTGNFTFPNSKQNQSSMCLPYKDEVWVKALKGATYVLIIALSLLGNSLTIYVISKKKAMRSTTNFLIANKCVADLFITCVSMPIVTMVNIQGFQNFTSFTLAFIVCKLNPVIHGTSMESAILSLTAIAFDRLFAIVRPLRKVITTSKVRLIIVGIWVVSLLTLVPLLYVIKIEFTAQDGGHYLCYERWPEGFDQELAAKGYTLVLFLSFYGIPLTTMAVVYVIIIQKLWGHGMEITELLPAFVRRKQETNRKIFKMLVTVVLTFALCWLTFNVRMFLGFFGETNNIPCTLQPHLYFMAFSIAHSNSAITPLIYYFFNQSFRRNFKKVACEIVPFLRRCGNEENKFLGETTNDTMTNRSVRLSRYDSEYRAKGESVHRQKLGASRRRTSSLATSTA